MSRRGWVFAEPDMRVAPGHVVSFRPDFGQGSGRPPRVRYVCSCGWQTDWLPTGRAGAAMLHHALDVDPRYHLKGDGMSSAT